jgi:tRNA-Thr(GGU) m(6)t(6)A37 methyltransferase TsaA
LKTPENQGRYHPQATLCFIGRVRTPFRNRADCPRSIRAARVNGGTAFAEVDEPYRAGLDGLERASHVILLYWMDEADRDRLVQHPRHLDAPRGVFSIRSPARPNPIALAVSRLVALDVAAGLLTLEQMDCRDGTPLLDIKPYWPTIDSVPDALKPD